MEATVYLHSREIGTSLFFTLYPSSTRDLDPYPSSVRDLKPISLAVALDYTSSHCSLSLADATVHRDLKPENVLYKTNSHHSPIVIADFGIAKHLEYDPPIENSSPTTGDGHGDRDREEESPGGPTEEKREGGVDSFAGSFGYAAPEVLAGLRHGLKVDCWSIG